jgi:hypothetical protein
LRLFLFFTRLILCCWEATFATGTLHHGADILPE